jgi:hypothetical protein
MPHPAMFGKSSLILLYNYAKKPFSVLRRI